MLSVAFSLLPKAIACASIVGVGPLVGVWSSVAMGVAAPAVGMRPGVIAGAAAVVVVPLGAFVAERGPDDGHRRVAHAPWRERRARAGRPVADHRTVRRRDRNARLPGLGPPAEPAASWLQPSFITSRTSILGI